MPQGVSVLGLDELDGIFEAVVLAAQKIHLLLVLLRHLAQLALQAQILLLDHIVAKF